MKTDYLYAIVNTEGECWRIAGRETEKVALPDLLAEGWRPIRETTFGIASGYILICFDREPEGQMGFGFGS